MMAGIKPGSSCGDASSGFSESSLLINAGMTFLTAFLLTIIKTNIFALKLKYSGIPFVQPSLATMTAILKNGTKLRLEASALVTLL